MLASLLLLAPTVSGRMASFLLEGVLLTIKCFPNVAGIPAAAFWWRPCMLLFVLILFASVSVVAVLAVYGIPAVADFHAQTVFSQPRYSSFTAFNFPLEVFPNLSPKPRSLHSVPQRDKSGLTGFPANESARRTGLHWFISVKSGFYLPAFEISRSCRTASVQLWHGLPSWNIWGLMQMQYNSFIASKLTVFKRHDRFKIKG